MNMQTNPTRARTTAVASLRGTLTDHEWAVVQDGLRLALDALGDRPQDMDRSRFSLCLLHQRAALKIMHRRLERITS